MTIYQKHKKIIDFTIGIAILLFLGIRLTADLNLYTDIDLGDEMYYLISGKTNIYIASRVLYPLWYKFLHIFTSDSVRLFYLNQKILIVLLPVCIYLFLYHFTNNFILSLLLSCCFLYSNTNIGTEYIYHGELVSVWLFKINNYTLCLLCLSSIILQKLSRKGFSTISLLTVAFFILSYCRNEYGVLFVLCSFIYIYRYFAELKKIKAEQTLFILFWISAAVSMYFYGLSIIISDFSNLHYVYSYSWNYLDRNNMPINITSDFVTPCLNAFGNQSGLIGFFISNPAEFIKNILFNFYTLFILNSFRIADIFLPQLFFNYKDLGITNYAIVCFIVLVTCLLIAKYALKNILQAAKQAMRFIKEHKTSTSFFAIFSYLDKNPIFTFNALVLSIIIFANMVFMYDPRYFIHFVPYIFLLIILLLDKSKYKKILKYISGTAIILLILLKPGFGNYYRQYNSPIERNILNTITLLKNYMLQEKKPHINILTNDGDYGQVIKGVTTFNYSIISMKSSADSSTRYSHLDTFDVIVINEYKEKESYLWRNQIKKYITENPDSFTLRKTEYLKYTNYIYMRKQAPKVTD